MPAISKTEKKLKQKAAQDELKALQAAIKAANQVHGMMTASEADSGWITNHAVLCINGCRCMQEQDLLQHMAAFVSYSKNGVAATISFCHGSQLAQHQREAAWALFESNMKDIYNADQQKWNPNTKRRELFHEDARYFLATDADGRLVGFTHFRFELEDNLLSDDELQLHRLSKHSSVVYCYELQLDPCMHRKGLGRRLMQMLELVVRARLQAGWLMHWVKKKIGGMHRGLFRLEPTRAIQPQHTHTPAPVCALPHILLTPGILRVKAFKLGMDMVLLTVQRSNTSAQAFYKSLGYTQHPSCPARNDFEDFDDQDPGHRILFKDLRRKS